MVLYKYSCGPRAELNTVVRQKKLYLKVPAGRIADVDKSQLCPEFKDRMKNGEFVNGAAIETG